MGKLQARCLERFADVLPEKVRVTIGRDYELGLVGVRWPGHARLPPPRRQSDGPLRLIDTAHSVSSGEVPGAQLSLVSRGIRCSTRRGPTVERLLERAGRNAKR